MKNAKNIDNPELKSFLDGYLAARPNMEIIKVTNIENINEIEKVIEANNTNNELKRLRVKRAAHQQRVVNVKQCRVSKEIVHQESRLLSALAGHRGSNININNRMYNNNKS